MGYVLQLVSPPPPSVQKKVKKTNVQYTTQPAWFSKRRTRLQRRQRNQNQREERERSGEERNTERGQDAKRKRDRCLHYPRLLLLRNKIHLCTYHCTRATISQGSSCIKASGASGYETFQLLLPFACAMFACLQNSRMNKYLPVVPVDGQAPDLGVILAVALEKRDSKDRLVPAFVRHAIARVPAQTRQE